MFLAVLLSLLLFCAGLAGVMLVCLYLVWYVSLHHMRGERPLEQDSKLHKQQGLSEVDLRRLPTVEWRTGEERTPQCGGGDGECAVCLEPLQIGDWCRVIPACGHAFHVQCADAWLSKRSACPICRASAACENEEKNGANGGAAAALPEEEGRERDQEFGRLPPPLAEGVVVGMPITLMPADCRG